MKLKVTQKLEKAVYTSKFELTEINTFDQEMLDDREGFIELNIGGDVVVKKMVDDGQGGQVEKDVVLLKQGDKFIKFAGDMPIEKAWMIAQHGEPLTQEIAEAETAQIEKRIQEIIVKMVANKDTFSNVKEIILTP